MDFNVLSLFDGAGSAFAAFNEANMSVENYEAYETDENAIAVAKDNFPKISEHGDAMNESFRKYNGKIDYLLGTTPCFAAGTLVLTKRGYVPIERIEVGDLVLTHNNRFKPVLAVGNKESVVCTLRTGFTDTIYTTLNHPFYVKDKKGDIVWKKIKDVDFCNEKISLNVLKNKHYNKFKKFSYGQLEKAGFAVAKGSINYLDFADRDIADAIIDAWNKMGINPNQSEEMFGFRRREIPIEILSLPKTQLKRFLTGYFKGLNADVNSKGTVVLELEAFPADKEIALSLSLAWAKIYHSLPVYGEKYDSKKGIYIQITFPAPKFEEKNEYLDGKVWTNSASLIRNKAKTTVYNLSVEEDESYTVNNIVVHNCNKWGDSASNDEKKTELNGYDYFKTFLKALNEVKPDFFIYELNKNINKKVKYYVSDSFGFSPVCINTSLVSAQSKNRFFWIGKRQFDGSYVKFRIDIPADKNIGFADIITIFKNKTLRHIKSDTELFENDAFRKMLNCSDSLISVVPKFAPVACLAKRRREVDNKTKKNFNYEPSFEEKKAQPEYSQFFEARKGNKSNTLTTVGKDNCVAIPVSLYTTELLKVKIGLPRKETNADSVASLKTLSENVILFDYMLPQKKNKRIYLYKVKNKLISPLCEEEQQQQYYINLPDGYYVIRELSLEEYKKLQTIPKSFSFSAVNENVAKNLISNSWTVDVLAHILKETTVPEEEKTWLLWGTSGAMQAIWEGY